MNESFNENQYEQNRIDQIVNENRSIPAMVQSRPRKNRGKGIALTLAVALASFGAGSLYTSHSWIKDQAAANAALEKSIAQSKASNMPNTNFSKTSTTKNGSGLSVSDIANMTSASVVEITTEVVGNDVFMRQYVTKGAGSGVVISSDGYIATNNHVIDGASKITVRINDGKEYPAKLIGVDPQTDVAVVKIEGVKLQPVTFGDSDRLQVGDTAVAIGNPLGKLGGTVTNGIISALNREIELEDQTMTLLQTNAAINPGNSGGGLFNDQGQLIGIVVAKSAESNVEGLGFAIPVNVVKEVVSSLMDVGYVQGRPVLGVKVADVTSPQQAYQYGVNQLGVYIMELTDGSKAKASGLKPGDCLVAADDIQINTTADLKKILQNHKVGDKLKVMVCREGKYVTLHVELSESVPETVAQPSPAVPSEK